MHAEVYGLYFHYVYIWSRSRTLILNVALFINRTLFTIMCVRVTQYSDSLKHPTTRGWGVICKTIQHRLCFDSQWKHRIGPRSMPYRNLIDTSILYPYNNDVSGLIGLFLGVFASYSCHVFLGLINYWINIWIYLPTTFPLCNQNKSTLVGRNPCFP